MSDYLQDDPRPTWDDFAMKPEPTHKLVCWNHADSQPDGTVIEGVMMKGTKAQCEEHLAELVSNVNHNEWIEYEVKPL
jgi:hypothetical protein